jgi:hypothetical protein
MGNISTSQEIISNKDNDYNPFKIPNILLESPSEFNPGVALKGCPPSYGGTMSEFARLPIETKAAYADGVIRGSYQQEWLKKQVEKNIPDSADDSVVGAYAYFYLKTQDNNILKHLTDWTNRNNA